MKDVLKVLNGISPYIRRAWDGHMLPGWELKERVIFDYEIVYIMEGTAIIKIEDSVYTAEPGELYIFRPGIKHSMKTVKNSVLRQPHIHFDLYFRDDSERISVCYRPMDKIKPEEMKLFREDINKTYNLQIPERIKLKNRNIIEKIIFDMIRDQENPDDYSLLRSKAYFIQLLTHILNEIYGEESTIDSVSPLRYEGMNAVGEYIRINYRSSIKLEQLAKLACVSKSHLLRLFKLVYKTSPLQYQMNIKIEKAKQMLGTLHNNISEIAQYLGFLDIQHFSKVFKKKTGMSPMEYRSNCITFI